MAAPPVEHVRGHLVPVAEVVQEHILLAVALVTQAAAVRRCLTVNGLVAHQGALLAEAAPTELALIRLESLVDQEVHLEGELAAEHLEANGTLHILEGQRRRRLGGPRAPRRRHRGHACSPAGGQLAPCTRLLVESFHGISRFQQPLGVFTKHTVTLCRAVARVRRDSDAPTHFANRAARNDALRFRTTPFISQEAFLSHDTVTRCHASFVAAPLPSHRVIYNPQCLRTGVHAQERV